MIIIFFKQKLRQVFVIRWHQGRLVLAKFIKNIAICDSCDWFLNIKCLNLRIFVNSNIEHKRK